MHYRTIMIILSLLLALSACGKKDDKKAGKPVKDDRQAIMVEELSLRPLDEYISVSGKLEGITDITMSSETSGRILQLYKRLGDSVAKGERIGKVENDIMQIRLEQAEAAYLSSETAMENARKNLSYAEATKAKNLISEAEYNSALSAFKGAKAGFDGAKAAREQAKLALDNSYLKAPEAGTVSNLLVASGQYINPGQAIATITDARTLVLKTGVGESQIVKLKKGQAAEINYVGNNKAFSGRIRGFGNRPLVNTSTYPVEIEIAQNSVLLPGMVVSARILTTRYNSLLYTPITNIVKEFDKNYVFVVTGDKAAKREVVLGRVIGENVELVSGVETGDTIVTSGSENLDDGSLITIRK
ncbi:MAG: efflux RND transporter periplasmic adaptor subunit [Candidatus Cloacimonas sp.]|jgi:RND family efflux transporter MFP subunit|nr:efflux RND transporter periplasmic adaptor subunit [Candidatus Cloacimonas sp.]